MSQKPSLLVVDDESGILDTLRILLRNGGFEVTTAQGGKAGLDQIRSGNHDIVLTDVTGVPLEPIQQCMQQKALGIVAPAGDEEDLADYPIQISYALL